MNLHRRVLSCSLLVFTILTPSTQANRFRRYTAHYKAPPNPVSVEIATYLGSEGSEWLSGGGFLSDGTVIAGGTSWGPSLKIHGSKAKLIGKEDSKAPDEPEIKKDRKGREVLPGWRHQNGTPFISWISSDLKSVEKVVRFPWRTGPATSVRVFNDEIYIAGMAGPQFDSAIESVHISQGSTNSTERGFVLKLDSVGQDLLWAKTFPHPGKGVQIRVHNDRILVEGAHVYAFDTHGTLQEYSPAPPASKWRRAVSPVDFSYCFGYDRNTRTGREPWRQPCLHIAPSEEEREKGAEGRNLYQWNPKLVGSNKYRLVSDSSIRNMYYTDDGMLWAVGWSDGGNTVLRKLPLDLDKGTPFKGLGFSAWGAGVLSLAHIIKINPKTYEVLNQTLWCGFLSGKDKPNSVKIDSFSIATDGSVLMAGASAFGLIQTGDALNIHPGSPGGTYISVLNHDLSSIRFSSSIAACGKVDLHDDGHKWSIVSQEVNGRHKVLFATSAIEKEAAYSDPKPAPTRNALQEGLKGGECDGYFVVMDLGPSR